MGNFFDGKYEKWGADIMSLYLIRTTTMSEAGIVRTNVVAFHSRTEDSREITRCPSVYLSVSHQSRSSRPFPYTRLHSLTSCKVILVCLKQKE